MLVWWATEVECVSAISRLERQGALSASGTAEALRRLDDLTSSWREIHPLEGVRRTARRLLRVHPLRAADALQLGAALMGAEGRPETLHFVSLDDRLIEAAAREGFPIVEIDAGSVR